MWPVVGRGEVSVVQWMTKALKDWLPPRDSNLDTLIQSYGSSVADFLGKPF